MTSLFSSRFSGGRRPPLAPVILVPGHHFFTDVVAVAAGTGRAELPALGALAIESSTPFSDEQLARGCFASSDGRGLVVFAAVRRKFAGEQEAWNAAGFVIPDFATWLPRGRAHPGIVVLETALGVTALEYAAGSTLPQRIVSRPAPPELAGDEAVAAAREHVLGRLGLDGRRIWRYRLGEVPCQQEGARFHFDWQPVDGAPAVEDAPLSVAQLWLMDVRDPAFLRIKQRDFRWNGIAWNTLLAIGAAAALLLLSEVALVGGGVWLSRRNAQIKAQAPAAQKAELNDGIVSRLASYIDRKPQPLELLAYINNLRPRSISFPKVSIESSARVIIEGTTSNPADVSEYETALKADRAIASAEISNNRLREGVATFQLTVTFRPGFNPVKAAVPVAPAANQPVAPQTVPVQP